MKKKNFIAFPIVWLVMILAWIGTGVVGGGTIVEAAVEYDQNMATEDYQVEVELSEDGSYLVTETISVDMLTPRHGIYRYVSQKGCSEAYGESGELERTPYYAEIEVLQANTEISTENNDGFFVMRLGSEDETVTGETVYVLQYRFTPQFQNKDFHFVYYNLFPMTWQNEIPEGSQFRFTFPKEFDREKLRLYSGQYGETNDGAELLELEWDGNTLSGVLKEELPFLNGITLFADMEEGYFTEIHTIPPVGMVMFGVAVGILVLIAVLYFLFGRDEAIIPSIQYQPPQGMDSAAVGYIIDGVVENKDILSLIIYWADKGYLTIEEEKKDKLFFVRTEKPFPEEAPAYAKTFFNRLFKKGDRVSLKSLKYKCADTIEASKQLVRTAVDGKGGIYTPASKAARVLCTILGIVPMAMFVGVLITFSKLSALRLVLYIISVLLFLAGICIFNYVVDSWYASTNKLRTGMTILGTGLSVVSVGYLSVSYLLQLRQGMVFNFVPALIAVVTASAGAVVFTGFMKKRTRQCVEWMGHLAGLRDFIETAELDRLKALAEENPQWFYHILPYTYVLGLSDIFADRLEGLAIPAPQWYTGYMPGYPGWSYYYFHRSLMHSMGTMSSALTVSEPPKASDGSGSGGFGGGGFSGGGFSGGGFGGGGGGSW